MNSKVLAYLLMAVFAPAIALAQAMPPGPAQPPAAAASAAPAAPAAPAVNPGGPMRMSPADRRALMESLRRSMEQAGHIRREARAKMLAALTAAHRALVARVIGELAVAATPNRRAAVRELDAALSASERAAILTAQRAEMTQMRAQMQAMMAQMRARMQQMRAQMQSAMPSPAPGMHQQWTHRPGTGTHGHHRTPDAGAVLLRSLMGGGQGPMVRVRVHGRGAPPPH